ncbi:MAG: HXXEE domain-containing protein [Actinomycetales bacterium]|nr:MAG: HXXEE domain-containing protein [Actinomycetales bacterium]
MDGKLDDRDRWLVPVSLAVSFVANDGEELITYVPTLRESVDALPARVWLPRWARTIDQRHINVAIAMMAGLCTTAVADGIRTRGRGRLYQDFQWVFGLHGFGHILVSAAAKKYTTGSVSAPLVVIPQLFFAVRVLRTAGVPRTVRPVRAVAIVGGWLTLSHTLGAVASARAQQPLPSRRPWPR